MMEIDVTKGKTEPRNRGDLNPPEFNSIDEERRHGLERLASAFRMFAHFGFDEGLAGHITLRDPEHKDHFWVNHPDLNAAAHSHSMYGKTFSTMGRLLEPITQDSCAFYDNHVLFDDFTGVVLETSEGDRIAEALGDKKAAILKNHGLLTTGKTVDEAAWGFLSMDRCCQSQLLAENVGQMQRIPDDVAEVTRGQVGSPFGMWASYQPIYDLMVEKDDSFLN